jgi:hypothetical protein
VHLSDRQLALLGHPTRKETLALVGWMSVAGLLGPTVTDPVGVSERLPPKHAAYWIGGLGKVASRRCGSDNRKYRQDVPGNRTRQVRVHKGKGALAS